MALPGAVEILRAAQKDNIFIEKLCQDVQEVVEALLGKANFLKWRNQTKLAAIGLYLTVTNLSSNQTLGEEYAGLVQTDITRRQVPTKKMIGTMILLHVFGHSMLEKVLKSLSNYLSGNENRMPVETKSTTKSSQINPGNSKQSQISPTLLNLGIKLTQATRYCLPFLLQLHLVIFYIQGKFYHLSKRLTGIHYVLVRQWFANQDENSHKNLKYLRLMSVINLILTAIHDSISFLNNQQKMENKPLNVQTDENSASECDPTRKCSLCLEPRKNPTLSQCGHLFCWECIMDWIQTKAECPICRTEILPSRLVPLQNHF